MLKIQTGEGPVRIAYGDWVATEDKATIVCKCPQCLEWNPLSDHVSNWGRGRLICGLCEFNAVIILHRFGRKLNGETTN